MKLYIKNMVGNRCKMRVKNVLDKIGIQYDSVEYGEVITQKTLIPSQRKQLNAELLKSGFELIADKKNLLMTKLKESIFDLEKYSDADLKTSFSDYINLNAKDNFIFLTKLFAIIEDVTTEKYILQRKIEIVKELLVNNEYNLNEIALKMHYSNATELSRQFISVTGLTPSHFKLLRNTRIDNPKNN